MDNLSPRRTFGDAQSSRGLCSDSRDFNPRGCLFCPNLPDRAYQLRLLE